MISNSLVQLLQKFSRQRTLTVRIPNECVHRLAPCSAELSFYIAGFGRLSDVVLVFALFGAGIERKLGGSARS
jgi:hypothetical protein